MSHMLQEEIDNALLHMTCATEYTESHRLFKPTANNLTWEIICIRGTSSREIFGVQAKLLDVNYARTAVNGSAGD